MLFFCNGFTDNNNGAGFQDPTTWNDGIEHYFIRVLIIIFTV